MSVGEALDKVWTMDADYHAALVLANEVIELRRRVEELETYRRAVDQRVESMQRMLTAV